MTTHEGVFTRGAWTLGLCRRGAGRVAAAGCGAPALDRVARRRPADSCAALSTWTARRRSSRGSPVRLSHEQRQAGDPDAEPVDRGRESARRYVQRCCEGDASAFTLDFSRIADFDPDQRDTRCACSRVAACASRPSRRAACSKEPTSMAVGVHWRASSALCGMEADPAAVGQGGAAHAKGRVATRQDKYRRSLPGIRTGEAPRPSAPVDVDDPRARQVG